MFRLLLCAGFARRIRNPPYGTGQVVSGKGQPIGAVMDGDGRPPVSPLFGSEFEVLAQMREMGLGIGRGWGSVDPLEIAG